MTDASAIIIKKLLVLFLVIAGLYFAKNFLIPLSIAGVLATLFLPFCRWMESKKVPRALAAFVCLVIVLTFIAAIIILISWQIAELSNDIVLLKQRIIETTNSTQKYIYERLGITAGEQWGLLKDQQLSIVGIMQAMAGSATSVFANFILTLVYVLFMLYYRNHLKDFILKLFPPPRQDEMKQMIYNAARVSQQYLFGLAIMIVCLWIMYGIGFSIMGVKNPLFFAILCGLLEIIPFIGNITGTTITLLFAVVHGAGLPVLGGIALTYGVVQFIQGWFLEPLIVGPQVKINPLFTIIVLVAGQLIWGIPGIILAIPLTAMFKIVCDHIPSLKPYGFLIGEIHGPRAESGLIRKIKQWYQRL